jgi:D-alanine-D-alanine ligase
MKNKLNVLVLAGGRSEERAVSLASSAAIAESLVRLGHNVRVIDAANGRPLLRRDGRYLFNKDDEASSTIIQESSKNVKLAIALGSTEYKDVDLVFIGLHGGAGEDGTIQALLNLAGKKYTGSGVLASALAMNKGFAKNILRDKGIPTPDWEMIIIKPKDDIDKTLGEIIKRYMEPKAGDATIKFPLIVKPNNSGSTIGLTLVKKVSELAAAVRKSAEISAEILIEEYIKGREITAAVLNGEPLPLVEIIPTNELYDYQCKYTKGKSRYVCPAEISSGAAAEIGELARLAYDTIGCAGLARIDFILGDNGKPYFLEVNTLPGMTELSLAPMAAKAAGIDFDNLVARICASALGKDERY